MWLFTLEGFFSAVQKPGDSELTLRSRAKGDLDRLRESRLPTLGPTIEGGGTDYPYRARVPHADLAEAMRELVTDIDYSNFKGAVGAAAGSSRAHVYSKVWSALLALEAEAPWVEGRSQPRSPRGKKAAYGGVVVDPRGRILLREPTDHYGGYVWTFPKGRPDQGEAPEACALREVREETGIVATIREPVAGWFEGDTTDTRFFVMDLVEDTGAFDSETATVVWVTLDEAETRVAETRSKAGKKRDAAVLAAVRALLARGR